MTDADRRAPGTVVAFDFGLRRIGVAVGECQPPSASALTTLAARAGQPDWSQLDKLIAEWEPRLLVAGLPHHADGTESATGAAVRRFAASLGARYDLDVVLVDESLSTRAARDELREQRRNGTRPRRVRPGAADAIAARLILENWHARHDEPAA